MDCQILSADAICELGYGTRGVMTRCSHQRGGIIAAGEGEGDVLGGTAAMAIDNGHGEHGRDTLPSGQEIEDGFADVVCPVDRPVVGVTGGRSDGKCCGKPTALRLR